jgi:hypothetical protein
MRHNFVLSSILVLPLALGACNHDHPGQTLQLPPRPTDGICAGENANLKVEILASQNGKVWAAGVHLALLERKGSFDIEAIGGGGGGGGARAASEAPGGGGGGRAEFVPILQRVLLERGYYLIDVGEGGAGGKGGWNYAEPPSQSDGIAGTATSVSRCSSGATIAFSHGGAPGKGDSATTGNRFGSPGDDLVDPKTGRVIGHGGAGGAPGGDRAASGDGGAGQENGSGGGGQGATRFQNDGVSHGGRGANGFARLTKIG